ncbi:MAG: hypothetical protein ISQ11_15605 [Planctomycetes bacterium]|nr:hypothetical protein [Planctomycetota bacterium]
MGVHSFCSVALIALLSSSCVTGDYNQTRVFQPVSVEAVDALEVGEAELGEALASLGAPLQVIELGAGAALAWGWKESTDWNITGSANIGNVRGRIQYADAALEFPGVVLFFDQSWTLVAKERGFLSELLLRPQLPRLVEEDGGVPSGA